jgi:hypothetical protein
MPAPKMLAGLPKPVLFGLYGAAGGLLGALVFGELLWRVLQPPPPKPAEPRLAVAASEAVQLAQGGVNKLFVRVARAGFDGEVRVRADGLPAGVTAPEVTIPAKASEGEIELRATANATVAPSTPVEIVARADGGTATVTAGTRVGLTTLPACSCWT